jgi:NADH-quinone oxidoreductase subunit M
MPWDGVANVDSQILTWILAIPVAGAVIIGLLPAGQPRLTRFMAGLTTTLTFLVSLYLWNAFDPVGGIQFEMELDWIPELGVSYHVGTDGISVLLVLLTTFICPLAVISSYSAISKSVRGFYASMLLLEAGMIGVFISFDLVLFYLFWEAMLIPMYFLIGIWGGKRRRYATIKFVLFTMFGSLLMLVAIVYMAVLNFQATGFWNFDWAVLSGLVIPYSTQVWLFGAFALAFAIKMPLFPFHTWLPDAHVEAPTAGSVILAGVLLKMGVYGFFRFALPWFPLAFAQWAPWLIALSVIGILYGALVAMVQRDVKSLVAYSSVAHMGFVMLGLCAMNIQSLSGSLLQSLNHGVTTGMLFLVVGMIYERRHTRQISDMGGLFKVMPIWTTALMIATLGSIGLPGTNGFVGEFLILLGTFKVNTTAAVLGTCGIVLAAVYMLWMLERVIFGRITHEENARLKDISLREKLILVPLVILVFWIGVYPNAFLGKMEPAIEKLLSDVYAAQTVSHPTPPEATEFTAEVISESR